MSKVVTLAELVFGTFLLEATHHHVSCFCANHLGHWQATAKIMLQEPRAAERSYAIEDEWIVARWRYNAWESFLHFSKSKVRFFIPE